MDKLIKAIRQSAGMNQEQFAKALGTTALSINRWENGKTHLCLTSLEHIYANAKSKNLTQAI